MEYNEIIKEYINLKKNEIEILNKINENENENEININNIKNIIIEEQKNKIIDLQKKLDNINNVNSNYENINKNLEKIINKKENDSKNVFILEKDMVSINFISTDNTLHYSIPCVNNNIFAEIEEKLYKKFPEYRETNTVYKGLLPLS